MKIPLNEIMLANPHWQSGKMIFSKHNKKRRSFEKILPWIDTQLIIALRGLRRTGKSVLLSQIVDRYVDSHKINPRNFLFFSFDLDDQLDLLDPDSLNNVLYQYFKQILKIEPQELQTPTIVALDEVQNVQAWQKVIKKYYDYGIPVKFIITGSASLFLKDAADSLAGRIMEFEIRPMDFVEHCRFAEVDMPVVPNNIDDRLKCPPLIPSTEHVEQFEKYLLQGGFPEVIALAQQGLGTEELQLYIKQSIIDKIIGKDFRKYYNIKNIQYDYKIFELLCFETGQPINLTKLAKEVGIAIDTLKNHLEIFVESGLVQQVFGWSEKPRAKVRAHSKYYPAAPALAFTYLNYQKLPPGSLVGHIAEGYLFQRLLELYDKEIAYYKDNANHEIDFYLKDRKLILESKYSDYISADDYSFLQAKAEQYNLIPWIITKSTVINEAGINSQPLILF